MRGYGLGFRGYGVYGLAFGADLFLLSKERRNGCRRTTLSSSKGTTIYDPSNRPIVYRVLLFPAEKGAKFGRLNKQHRREKCVVFFLFRMARLLPDLLSGQTFSVTTPQPSTLSQSSAIQALVAQILVLVSTWVVCKNYGPLLVHKLYYGTFIFRGTKMGLLGNYQPVFRDPVLTFFALYLALIPLEQHQDSLL